VPDDLIAEGMAIVGSTKEAVLGEDEGSTENASGNAALLCDEGAMRAPCVPRRYSQCS
jgi:hypothetical protein